MIISHKHKYVFIQLDKTASTAIAKELYENYEGTPILWKHARYEDFMKIATHEEKKYFIFSGIRNPLDTTVSYYHLFKLGWAKTDKSNIKRIEFIKRKNANFNEYFKKFLIKNIYEDWKTKNFNKLDYIYRYENIQQEFAIILKKLNIPQKRPLPVFNKTPEKNIDYLSYYDKNIQGISKIIYNRFMKRFNYKFPKEWKEPNFYERFILSPFLYIKYIFQILEHIIIDHPSIYKRYYKIKIKNENSHIS